MDLYQIIADFFIGIRVMIGKINLLLNFNIKMQLQPRLPNHLPHPIQLTFLILHSSPPMIPPPDTYAIIFLELLFLTRVSATSAKYSNIFILSTTTLTTTGSLDCNLKWKKVFDDGFREYWGCIGSNAGVIINFPSSKRAFYMFPESKLEETCSLDPYHSN